MMSGKIPRSLILLISLFALAPFTRATAPLYLEINSPTAPFADWSFAGNYKMTNFTDYLPPPAGFGMTMSMNIILGQYQGAQFHSNIPFYVSAAPKYQYFYLFIAANNVKLSQIVINAFTFNGAATNAQPLTLWHPDVLLTANTWVEVPIKMTALQGNANNMDTFWVQNQASAPANISLCGFFADSDVMGTGYTAVAPPPPPPLVLPPIGTKLSDGTVFNGTIVYTNYGTAYGGNTVSGDAGADVEFWCANREPFLGYIEAQNVTIQAFRESNIGPIPMNIYKYATFGDDGRGNKMWSITDMFVPVPKQVDPTIFPHPGYVCAMHNVDWFEIGNTTTANRTLVVWMPDVRLDMTAALGAYAMYVLAKNGTVAVELRVRPPNYFFWGNDWSWVINKGIMNCAAGHVRWQCPDHIFFKDTQLGVMHTALDWLHPLSDLEATYFQNTGYMASMDIFPVVQKLTTYAEKNYAIPFGLSLELWLMNTAAANALQNTGIPKPPPKTSNGAWWDWWNVDTLNAYFDGLLAQGYSNLFPLPSSATAGGETRWTNYIAFSQGGSLLNADGRCGLLDNNRTELAFNKTLVRWRGLSNWNYTALLNYNASDPVSRASVDKKKYGVLAWRPVYSLSASEFNQNITRPNFQDWVRRDPLDNPFDEPKYSFADPMNDLSTSSASKFPNYTGMVAPAVNPTYDVGGFEFDSGYGDSIWIASYPATGSAYLSAKLVGINANPAVDKDFAYDALMIAIARNPKVHFNSPAPNDNNQGGVAGYLSATHAKGYEGTGKKIYDEMLEHAMFAGSPVAQGMQYGLVEDKNPMALAWNEILYKNMSVRKAFERACVLINEYTKPPCTIYDYEVYLTENVTTNKANMNYRLRANSTGQCSLDLANSVQTPMSRMAVIPAQYVSGQSKIGKAMTGLAGACMVIVFFLIIMFIIKRDAPVIRAASRQFSLLILIGGELTLASIIMRTSSSDELNWPQCFGTYWFFAIGYAFIMGSLGVKTYRVDRIFRNAKTGFKLPDWKLFIYEGFMIAGEVVILLMYQLWLDDPSHERDVEIGLDITAPQKSCPQVNQVPSILLYVWNAGLILFAAIYAFRTRNVNSAFNENIFTVAAIGLISVISIVIVPVISLINSPEAIFLLISLGTILGTVLSILVFAIPKLLTAFGFLNFSELVSAMTNTVTGKSPRSSTIPGPNVHPSGGVKGSATFMRTGSAGNTLSQNRSVGGTSSSGA